MPEAIIRDPKQNQDEFNFGILFHYKEGYCAYRKQGNNIKRILPAGWEVDTSHPVNLKIPIPWDSKVTKVVNITRFEDPQPNKPIVNKLKNAISAGDLHPGNDPKHKIETYE
jgi:hypothetical protein